MELWLSNPAGNTTLELWDCEPLSFVDKDGTVVFYAPDGRNPIKGNMRAEIPKSTLPVPVDGKVRVRLSVA